VPFAAAAGTFEVRARAFSARWDAAAGRMEKRAGERQVEVRHEAGRVDAQSQQVPITLSCLSIVPLAQHHFCRGLLKANLKFKILVRKQVRIFAICCACGLPLG